MAFLTTHRETRLASLERPPSACLKQSELTQLAPHRLRHVFGTGRGAIEIERRILRLEIAPTLERAERARLHRHDLRREHQVALSDATLVDIGTHGDEPLPTGDLATDHPVERATVDQLLGAFGDHAGAVQMLRLFAARLSPLLADPRFQILDRVTAYAKLDQMQCHDANGWRAGVGQGSW